MDKPQAVGGLSLKLRFGLWGADTKVNVFELQPSQPVGTSNTRATSFEVREPSPTPCCSRKVEVELSSLPPAAEQLYYSVLSSGCLQQLRRTGEEVDASFLLRWLRARKQDVDATAESIIQHAQWRDKYLPTGRIEESEIQAELDANKVFLQGTDSLGRPVIVIQARNHNMNTRNFEETKRLICYTLDNSIAAADLDKAPDGKICCIFDLSGLALRNLDVAALRAIFDTLQQHYPERLAQLWFVNAPLIFWGIWKLVCPFIQPATRDKLVFVGLGGKDNPLRRAVGEQVLPREYGGASPLVPVQHAVALRRKASAPLHMRASAASFPSSHPVSLSPSRIQRLKGAGNAVTSAAKKVLRFRPWRALMGSGGNGSGGRGGDGPALALQPSGRLRVRLQQLAKGEYGSFNDMRRVVLGIILPGLLLRVLLMLAQKMAVSGS